MSLDEFGGWWNGNRRNFTRIVESMLVRRHVHSQRAKDVAEEIVQVVACRLLRTVKEIRHETAVSYAVRSLRNATMDWFRRQISRERQLENYANSGSQQTDLQTTPAMDDDIAPEHKVIVAGKLKSRMQAEIQNEFSVKERSALQAWWEAAGERQAAAGRHADRIGLVDLSRILSVYSQDVFRAHQRIRIVWDELKTHPDCVSIRREELNAIWYGVFRDVLNELAADRADKDIAE